VGLACDLVPLGFDVLNDFCVGMPGAVALMRICFHSGSGLLPEYIKLCEVVDEQMVWTECTVMTSPKQTFGHSGKTAGPTQTLSRVRSEGEQTVRLRRSSGR